MHSYKIEFILEDRIQEALDDSAFPLLTTSELLEILFQMKCSLPRGLEIRKGSMSVRKVVEGKLGKQMIERNS